MSVCNDSNSIEANLKITPNNTKKSVNPSDITTLNGLIASHDDGRLSERSYQGLNWKFNVRSKCMETFAKLKNHYYCYYDDWIIVDDGWDIPYERIHIRPDEYHQYGSQGDVFYGSLNNTPVAVKRVKDASLAQIRHLKDLNHKNVIKFLGISGHFNYFYIIMEWCPFGTLHYHLHNGKQLSATILSDFSLQIADGMKYLHSKNIIHRDLKPSNILLTHGDVLKISDFGTHKVLKDKVINVTYIGTHAYMAPEVIRGDPYSLPVDVWSYGVVLWEILIGDEPYKNLSNSAVLWAVGKNSFHLPIPSSLPEGFRIILNSCWKAQPEDRITFRQMWMLLQGAKSEIIKISKERWLPLQSGWKREARDLISSFKPDPITEDQLCHQKRQAFELMDQAQKMRAKNNDLYLKLQLCCLDLQRERQELQREREELQREKVEFQREREKVQQKHQEKQDQQQQ